MAKHEFYEYLWKLRSYFLGSFSATEFGYVVYPFLRIFKFFGFMPIILDPISILNERSKVVWDMWAVLWYLLATVIYVVGFHCGVCAIGNATSLETLRENMVITYFTNWGQILFLFILGGHAVLSSWLNLQQFQHLFVWISKIDQQLELATGRELNYTRMRNILCIQFIMVLLVTAPLSMVNCVVIFKDLEVISLWSGCFWFVCFFPLFLLLFKEFQFYNLMFVLKSKFDLINAELSRYGGSSPLRPKNMQNDLIEIFSKPRCSLETLKKLMRIYVNLADSVELLLQLFAWHLFLLTSASFGAITIQGYNLFAALVAQTMDMSRYQLTIISCWIVVQMTMIAINVATCSMTDKAMSSTGPILHRISSECYTVPGLDQILQIFSMEVMQRKNNFTAAGFFSMDYKLITSIIAAVTTYLLIIIQFHTSMGGNHPDPSSV